MKHRNFFVLIITIILVNSCKSKLDSIVKGGVYLSNSIAQNTNQNYDSIEPILAFRIDNIILDTLLVKYRFGFEASMDIDYVFNKKCNCYISENPLLFSPRGSLRKHVSIYSVNKNKILLKYVVNDSIIETEFQLSYIDFTIDLKTHRNPYYAEDSFNLFRETTP